MSNVLNPRQVARQLVLQTVYAWLVTQEPMAQIERDIMSAREEEILPYDKAYYQELLHQMPLKLEALDVAISRHASRALSAINPIEHAALLIGTYELTHRLEIPFKVVINEAVNLVKTFGATDGHRFVNGILDKLAAELRVAPKGPLGT